MDESNREYKSGLFCDIFGTKRRLAELHTALTDVPVTEADIIINTLMTVIYGRLKNDLSYEARGKTIVISEHQSTPNPNMPLRMLLYAAELYKPFVMNKNIYREKLVHIPAPKLVVFYNGMEEKDEEWHLRLSDAFKDDGAGDIEATVRVLNINYSPTYKILQKSPSLLAYSIFIEKTREGVARGLTLGESLSKAIDYSISHGYLRDYFENKKRTEVAKMLSIQWNMDEALAVRGEERYEDGLLEGRISMIKNMILAKLPIASICQVSGMSEDEIRALGYAGA